MNGCAGVAGMKEHDRGRKVMCHIVTHMMRLRMLSGCWLTDKWEVLH